MIDHLEEQAKRTTLKWMYTQALTVLSELMTSDDDRIALRAAQTVLKLFERDGTNARNDQNRDQKEGRLVIRYGNTVPRAPSGPDRSDRGSGALPSGGLRETLGKDRDR